MAESISFVVPKELKKALRDLRQITGDDQSTLLRRLLSKGLAEVRMDMAVDYYAKEKTSLEKSARIADVSLWEFLDELRKRNVGLKYSLADAKNEIEMILSRRMKRGAS